uniref:Uncharacterized protein n=1 Tax=Rhizophagus irregularis (strain DAOM 181602 / DAOM 197198 / MUCL 43194) TaxID=747089 RepID=U9SPG1_RHIID
MNGIMKGIPMSGDTKTTFFAQSKPTGDKGSSLVKIGAIGYISDFDGKLNKQKSITQVTAILASIM